MKQVQRLQYKYNDYSTPYISGIAHLLPFIAYRVELSKGQNQFKIEDIEYQINKIDYNTYEVINMLSNDDKFNIAKTYSCCNTKLQLVKEINDLLKRDIHKFATKDVSITYADLELQFNEFSIERQLKVREMQIDFMIKGMTHKEALARVFNLKRAPNYNNTGLDYFIDMDYLSSLTRINFNEMFKNRK